MSKRDQGNQQPQTEAFFQGDLEDSPTLAPPSEEATSPHHDPPPPLDTEDLVLVLGRLLDTKLEPLLLLRDVVEQLRMSLDLAIHEFRRRTDAHSGEIDSLRMRIETLEARVSRVEGKQEIAL